MTPGTDWPALVARKWNRGLDPALNLSGRSHLGYQTARPAPYTARVTLKEACEARGLSVYQVAMSGYAQGTVDPGTVYRLARGATSRIDLHTLATLAGIIHTLTGQPVTVGELLTLDAVKEEASAGELVFVPSNHPEFTKLSCDTKEA